MGSNLPEVLERVKVGLSHSFFVEDTTKLKYMQKIICTYLAKYLNKIETDMLKAERNIHFIKGNFALLVEKFADIVSLIFLIFNQCFWPLRTGWLGLSHHAPYDMFGYCQRTLAEF